MYPSTTRIKAIKTVKTVKTFSSKITQPAKVAIRMSSSYSSSSTTTTTRPIVELREYDILPSKVQLYTQCTSKSSELRKSLTPLRLFTMPETGGTLNVATHLYYYKGGFEERNDKRRGMGQCDEWKEYLKEARTCMQSQKSTIFVEAPLVDEIDQICGLAPGLAESKLLSLEGGKMNNSNDCIYEVRRYQLKLGYDTVPNFLSLYKSGLPSKLNAPGTDPSTALITLLYSEVGQLNEVIEIWRHGSTDAMERSRVASRSANEWRTSIANIAELATLFTSSIHKPLSFSPLR